MPFLDWVIKAQAQRTTAGVPYRLLQFQTAHGDPEAETLLIRGDNGVVQKVTFFGNTGNSIFGRFAYDSADGHPKSDTRV